MLGAGLDAVTRVLREGKTGRFGRGGGTAASSTTILINAHSLILA